MTHTHGLRLGDVQLSATSNEYNFMFDMYIFEALQQRYDKDIELVANSKFSIGTFSSGTQAELIDKIIISEIPNYNSADGPYHSCMEELRENKFIKDFRQWIVKEHSHLQRSEIRDICVGVERNMNEVQNQIFRKYLDEKSGFTLFKSTSSTLLKTIFGAVVPAASLPISIADAFAGNIKNGKQALDAKSLRWQGFIMDSRKIIQEMQ